MANQYSNLSSTLWNEGMKGSRRKKNTTPHLFFKNEMNNVTDTSENYKPYSKILLKYFTSEVRDNIKDACFSIHDGSVLISKHIHLTDNSITRTPVSSDCYKIGAGYTG